MLAALLLLLLVVVIVCGCVQDLDATGLGNDRLVLHMMWTTSVFTFQSLHLRVLERYFYHHPRLHAKLYVADPTWSLWHAHLSSLLHQGYSLEVIQITDDFLTDLVTAPPCKDAAEWVQQQARFRTARFYYSHLTDLLRFCLLAVEGGVYSDFDALLLRPFPLADWFPRRLEQDGGSEGGGRVIIGKDRIGVGEECRWCLTDGRTYLAPGVMLAEPNSPLLKAALRTGFNVETYDAEIFNLVGPRAITVAARTVPKALLGVLETDRFYPVNYQEARQLFRATPQLDRLGDDPRVIAEKIKRRAISLHFFGVQTKREEIEDASVMSMLVGPAPSRDDTVTGPEYLVIQTMDEWVSVEGGIRWMGGEAPPEPIMLDIEGGARISARECRGSSVAALNACLDQVRLWVPSDEPTEPMFNLTVACDTEVVRRIAVYNLSRLLTVTVKTMDRMHKVVELVSSLRRFYPRLPVIVSNDGEAAFSIGGGMKRGNFDYVPLEYDVGLSAARNRMLQLTRTPLVMILDDDFVFTVDSDLGYLVHRLVQNKLDIVAASSPADQSAHGIDYAGLFHHDVSRRTLSIVAGNHGGIPNSSCTLVDIVPNIFVARTSLLRRLLWDEELKLGEHEDFFLRARQHDVRVATCRSVSLLHRQEPHWLHRTAYDRMRSRVWRFLQRALEKHELRRLQAFGLETMALQPLDVEDIRDVRVFDLQPFSVAFAWSCSVNYHFYQVDIFDITHCTDDDDPGLFHHEQAVEPSLRSPRTPQHALITGLDPERYYRLVLRPGNHTDVHPTGPELIIRTPAYHSEGNLIINGDFDGSNLYWERSLGAQSGLVPLHRIHGRPGKGPVGEESIPTRPGAHATHALGHRLGDFAASLFIAAGPPTIHVQPSLVALFQDVPIVELPAACMNGPCQLSASAWCRVDRLFGPPSLLSLSLCLSVHGSAQASQRWCEDFDPYEETRWQMVAFSVGINLASFAEQAETIRLSVWLRAPRGAAFFDDFYLAARPIPRLADGSLGDGFL